MEITRVLLHKIWHDEAKEFVATEQGSSKQLHHLSNIVKSDFALFCVLKATYFTFLLIFSLLSTAAVVYTIASIYTGRDATFKKVMTVVPRVWKRLMVTFLCTFFAFLIYNILAYLIANFILTLIEGGVLEFISAYVLFIAYVVGFVYMTIIWQLASVVTVLESLYGVRAMLKSMNLIKGNRWVAIIIFFNLILSFYSLQFLFEWFVVDGDSKAPARRVGLGILCFFLLFKLFLFGLVIQTVLYLVCKSYHHENIDKSNLSDHLEAYLGDYQPLTGKEVQLEEYDI